MYHSIMPGSILTPIVSMMSEYKDSPKNIQSSLGTTQLQVDLKAIGPWSPWGLRQIK